MKQKRRSFLFTLSAIVVAASIEVFGMGQSPPPVESVKKYDEVKYSGIRHCQKRIDELGFERYRVAPADHNFTSDEYPEFDTEDEALEWAGVKRKWGASGVATNDRNAPELPMPVFPETPDLSTLITRIQEADDRSFLNRKTPA